MARYLNSVMLSLPNQVINRLKTEADKISYIDTDQDRDLEIVITSSLKPNEQVTKVAVSANSTLGRIKHTFMCLDEETLPALYKAMICPGMELAIQARSPYLKDISMLEKAQRHAIQPRSSKILHSYPNQTNSII